MDDLRVVVNIAYFYDISVRICNIFPIVVLRQSPLIGLSVDAVPDQLRRGADRQIVLLRLAVAAQMAGGADGGGQYRRAHRRGQQNEQEGHQDGGSAVVFHLFILIALLLSHFLEISTANAVLLYLFSLRRRFRTVCQAP